MEQLPPKSPRRNWPSFPLHTPPSPPPPASWLDEFLDFSASRRTAHRRTVSDPIAFVEDHHASNAFDRLDEEQLTNMFSDKAAPPSPAAKTSSSANPSSPSDQDVKKSPPSERVTVQPKTEPVETDGFCQETDDTPPQSENISGDAIVDPKRIKRILANRQSAQRSRVRKLQYISELERSVISLQSEVSALSPRVAYLDHQRLLLNVDNNTLKERIAALAQDNIFKDAHQEALRKEIERLQKIYQEQNMKAENGGAPLPTGNCTEEDHTT